MLRFWRRYITTLFQWRLTATKWGRKRSVHPSGLFRIVNALCVLVLCVYVRWAWDLIGVKPRPVSIRAVPFETVKWNFPVLMVLRFLSDGFPSTLQNNRSVAKWDKHKSLLNFPPLSPLSMIQINLWVINFILLIPFIIFALLTYIQCFRNKDEIKIKVNSASYFKKKFHFYTFTSTKTKNI